MWCLYICVCVWCGYVCGVYMICVYVCVLYVGGGSQSDKEQAMVSSILLYGDAGLAGNGK